MAKHRTRLFLILAAILIGAACLWRPWTGRSAETRPQRVDAASNPAPQPDDVVAGRPGEELLPAVGLSSEARAMLDKNGFVVVANEAPFDKLAHLYSDCKYTRQPIFVTSDSLLHTSHLVFDWYLRFLETAHLRTDLINLTDSGIAMSMAYWDQTRDRQLKQAALNNAAYFYLAKMLLGEADLSQVPADLKGKLQREMKLIEDHRGFAQSPLFGYKEDYSQYVPRGHYSRSPELSSYFRAMMWFGRMTMRLKATDLSDKDARRETDQALLICKALNEGKAKGERTFDVWNRIEEVTAFFAGKSDDLTPDKYMPLARQVFGPDLALTRLSDQKRLDEFRTRASKLGKPGILSTFGAATDPEDWRSGTQGFRLMGQRFTPDGYIFQELVFNRVGEWLGRGPKPFTLTNAQGLLVRGFPRGLDILAAVGSDEALAILKDEGDTSYVGYRARLAELRKKYAKMPGATDLYSARLAVLSKVLSSPGSRTPAFMKSKAWQRKSLATALGTWTELRHDTILYSKQSYSMAQVAFATMGKGGPVEKPKPVHGYVEPCPEVYAGIRDMVVQLRGKLQTLGFPPDQALTGNLDALESLLSELETIALKELKGEPVTDAEQELIEDFGARLRRFNSFMHYADVSDMFQSRLDNLMPIVADVHTDSNSGMVLEEGIGHPLAIYATVPVDGKPTVCKGAVYSYYEFKQPMSRRLTDEEWRKMLTERKNPGLPAWMAVYIPRAEER